MSLINQMLKDLEQRNASAEGVNPLAGEVRSTHSQKRRIAWPSLVLILLLILMVGAGIWWKLFASNATPSVTLANTITPEQRHPPPSMPPPPPAPVESPAVPPPAETPGNSLPGPDKELSAAPTAPVPPEKKSRVAVNAAADTAAPPAKKSKPKAEEEPKEENVAKPAPSSRIASLKSVTPQQKSDNLYKRAVSMLQQGRVAEARTILWQALDENPANHNARQLLVGLLVENKRNGDAMLLLQDGIRLAPEQTGFVMALARLQVEAGDQSAGLKTLEQGLEYAADDADYHGFYAALLQRADRHEEAVAHYLSALRSDPTNTSWLVGIGISLQAQEKYTDAREAFERARQIGQLSPELSSFVDQRLLQLKGK